MPVKKQYKKQAKNKVKEARNNSKKLVKGAKQGGKIIKTMNKADEKSQIITMKAKAKVAKIKKKTGLQ